MGRTAHTSKAAAAARATEATAKFNAVADAVVNDLADGQRKIDELNEAAWRVQNGYQSLVARAQADEAPKYGSAARADDSPVMYRSTVARPQDHDDGLGPRRHVGGLDSVERSLQTIEAYLGTLQGHLPPTALDESFKEFQRELHRAEAALVRAYTPPAAPATPAPSPARPTNPSASRIVDIVQAAVDEVMAEA